jgi:hypothetical protein
MRQYRFPLFLKLGILLLLVLTFGCSFIREGMQDGIGQPISTMIDSWGPPSRVTSDSRGGSVYIWYIWNYYGYANWRLDQYMFWVDSNGIIYKWG